MKIGLCVRLVLVTFLDLFVMRAWVVRGGNYMGEIEISSRIFWACAVPISAFISPPFSGFVADRHFDTKKRRGTEA